MNAQNQNQNPSTPAKSDDGGIAESDLEAVAGGNRGLLGGAGGKAGIKISDGPKVNDPTLSPAEQAAAAAASQPPSSGPRPA